MIQLQKFNDHNETIFGWFRHLQGAGPKKHNSFCAETSQERPEPTPDVPIDTQQYRSYKAHWKSAITMRTEWGETPPLSTYWFHLIPSLQKIQEPKNMGQKYEKTRFFFHFFPYRFSDLLMGIASGAGASNWPSHSPHSDATVWRGQSRFVTVGSKLVFFPQVWGMNICLTSINYP